VPSLWYSLIGVCVSEDLFASDLSVCHWPSYQA
jgi:hypothetical protein